MGHSFLWANGDQILGFLASNHNIVSQKINFPSACRAPGLQGSLAVTQGNSQVVGEAEEDKKIIKIKARLIH